MFFVITLVPKGLQRSLNTQKNCLFLPANIKRCPESETGRKTEKKTKIFRKPVNLKNHDLQT